jgi:hypothetical protein
MQPVFQLPLDRRHHCRFRRQGLYRLMPAANCDRGGHRCIPQDLRVRLVSVQDLHVADALDARAFEREETTACATGSRSVRVHVVDSMAVTWPVTVEKPGTRRYRGLRPRPGSSCGRSLAEDPSSGAWRSRCYATPRMLTTSDAPSISQRPSTPPLGLTSGEANRRLAEFGPNEIKRGEATSRWKVLANQFVSPLIWLLLAASVISAPPRMIEWLGIVFRTWGGFMAGLGIVLLAVAAHLFTLRRAFLSWGTAVAIGIAFGRFLLSNLKIGSDYVFFIGGLFGLALIVALFLILPSGWRPKPTSGR